jgi:hypothetical protein
MGQQVELQADPYQVDVQLDVSERFSSRRNLNIHEFDVFDMSEIFRKKFLRSNQTAIEHHFKNNGLDLNDYAKSIIWHPFPKFHGDDKTITLHIIIVPHSNNSEAFQTHLNENKTAIQQALTDHHGYPTTVDYLDYIHPPRKPTSVDNPLHTIIQSNNVSSGTDTTEIVIEEEEGNEGEEEEEDEEPEMKAAVVMAIMLLILAVLGLSAFIVFCTRRKAKKELEYKKAGPGGNELVGEKVELEKQNFTGTVELDDE